MYMLVHVKDGWRCVVASACVALCSVLTVRASVRLHLRLRLSCCSLIDGEGSYQLLLRDNLIVQGDGIFDTRSVHSFDIQPSDITVPSSPSPGGSSSQGSGSDEHGNESDTTSIDSTDDPSSSVPPLPTCPAQVHSVPPQVPLMCFADMGRAAIGNHIVFNESPLVDLGCFPMRGNGTGLSVESVDGSAFGFISEHVRSIALTGNKDTQMLDVKDASALSPGTSDFSVMLWVKLAPNSSPGGDIWIAAHGIGASIHST